MANLKVLKTRIKSVKSTQKITKAMKMVSAAKLRKAQERAEAARPFAQKMERMLGSLAISFRELENAPALLSGTGKDDTQLLIAITSDRGLCGAFNSSIVRATRNKIQEYQRQGKKVTLLLLGKKAGEQLKTPYQELIVEKIEGLSKKPLQFANAEAVAQKIISMFEEKQFDRCTLVYNHFKSVISQQVTFQQLIPLDAQALTAGETQTAAVYDYEPEEEEILKSLLPRNIAVQIYKALLDSTASEQAARMTAMDNATRNAGEMISGLTLQYNRTRQATITKELIEIISGAEAV